MMSKFLRSSKFIYMLIYLSYGNTLVTLDMWPFSLDLTVNIKLASLSYVYTNNISFILINNKNHQ